MMATPLCWGFSYIPYAPVRSAVAKSLGERKRGAEPRVSDERKGLLTAKALPEMAKRRLSPAEIDHSMLSLFQRKRLPSIAAAAAPEIAKGWSMPKAAAALLVTPRRQRLLEHIWQRTSLSRVQFDTLYRAPIERYAVLVQDFPASESHHHAYSGGMLDHTLEIVAYALKLRQSHLLPVAAPPETQAAQAEAWTAAVAYAALLHDVGKIAVDLHVEYENGERWHPWHGALCRPYRLRYQKARQYRLHSAAAGLLYASVLDAGIMDWLSGFPDLWGPLLYVLAGQYEHGKRPTFPLSPDQ